MNIQVTAPDLVAGQRLNMKKVDGAWSLWDENTLIAEHLAVQDAKLGLDHYKCIVSDDCASVRVVRFADLHRHSHNSLKDGMIKVPDMVAHTEYAGALTDHGNMYGFLEYYKAMKDAGKHPIIGFEAYQEDLLGKLSRAHLILLAKNDQGYRNLLKLTSESFDHFYYAPHVTWEMLEKYHEGIICTSACIGGVIPQAIIHEERNLAEGGLDSMAEVAIKRFLKLFGDDFYLEIQRHGLDEEPMLNAKLVELSKKYNIPLVATTDSHYLRKEDAFAHEVLLCMQTKKTIGEPHFQFKGTGYHMHTSEEMEELFHDIPEALDNTLLLAEKCNVNVPLGEVNLPNYAIPEGFATPFEYFQHLCKDGFRKRFNGTPHLTEQEYLDRFQYEMDTIKNMHFESYFIIVWDFINYARKVGVYIGPGRGSAAGSLLAYCMGITDMDPIRFKLLFERFLNPERVSWPD